MSANHRIKPNMKEPVLMYTVETGTLSANILSPIKAPFKWQVSDDGKEWVDTRTPNLGPVGPEPVCVPAPSCVYGKRHARVVVVGTDEAIISYNYRVTPI